MPVLLCVSIHTRITGVGRVAYMACAATMFRGRGLATLGNTVRDSVPLRVCVCVRERERHSL